jgi:hypothetical protein
MTDQIARSLTRSRTPAVILTFPLEAPAWVQIDPRTEGEQLRAVDWVCRPSVLADVVKTVNGLKERYGRAA